MLNCRKSTASWKNNAPLGCQLSQPMIFFFAMLADEFRDAMAIRYYFGMKSIPSTCDGCGEYFDLNHALKCKKGGLVTARHNEARDLNCDLCTLAGLAQVTSKSI